MKHFFPLEIVQLKRTSIKFIPELASPVLILTIHFYNREKQDGIIGRG